MPRYFNRLRILFMVTALSFFTACSSDNWFNQMWQNNKILLIAGILAIVIFISLILMKLLRNPGSNEEEMVSYPEEELHTEQEFTIQEPESIESVAPQTDVKTEESDFSELQQQKSIELEKPVEKKQITILIKGEAIGSFELSDKGTIIGRDPAQSSIAISEPIISKSHLRITPVPDSDDFLIEDLNSTNGTYINGSPINKITINSDQHISLGRKGNVVIQFKHS